MDPKILRDVKSILSYLLGNRFVDVLKPEDTEVLKRTFVQLANTDKDVETLLRSHSRTMLKAGYLKSRYAAVAEEMHNTVKETAAKQSEVVRENLEHKKIRATVQLVTELVAKRKSVIEAKRLESVAKELADQLLNLWTIADNLKYVTQELSKRERDLSEEDD